MAVRHHTVPMVRTQPVGKSTMSETRHAAWQTFADLLDPPKNPYVRDPVGWVTSTLGEFWWSGQHRMAQSVVKNRYSAFKASHDVSKSHTMSRLALWWIDVHPPGEAFVVTTAPTTPQVEVILWRYMGNAHKKGGLPGRITLDAKWYIGNELVAYGRKPADYDPAAFQGIHARYVLVIIDKAGGVPKSIFDAVDALATNIDARVVAVGNPMIPHRTSPRSASQARVGTSRRSAPSTLLHTRERRFPRNCCRCWSRPSGSKSARSDGESTVPSTNRRCSESSPTSPTTL
jgi:hypothetical protein